MQNKATVLTILAFAVSLAACQKPAPAKVAVQKGGKVSFSYVLTVEGKQAESKTLSCAQGSCGTVPALEEALVGKYEGDKFKVSVPAGKGIAHMKEYVREVSRTLLPSGKRPLIGSRLEATTTDGKKLACVVKDTSRKTIILDCNSPYAGKALDFEVEITGVNGK